MKTHIYSTKVKKDLNIKLYSDLHYIPNDDLTFLQKSVEKMELNKPNYIFFLGDLIDDSKYTINELKQLFNLLTRMTKLTNVILVLGNHDQFTKNDKGKWEEHYNQEFVDALKNTGIHVLQNEVYKDDNIYVYGTRFPGMYYENREPIGQFIDTIKNINYNEPQLLNFLAEHSPEHTFNGEFISMFDNLKDVDVTFAGHFHNACVPWYISKILPGNRGVVDPYMNFFPDNARGEKQITETNYGIISTPLTTFASNSKFGMVDKILYPPVEQDILIKKK